MRKIHRGSSPAEGEPLSAGRVEYLEAARQRARSRRLRRGAIIVAVLTVLVLFATGAVGTSIARAKDLVDSVHITLTPNTGWPQQTGITEPTAVAKLSGGFAEMDTDTCVVYSFGGAKLNSVQSGYARPALAAGKSRFVLYNRSGNELRVESRTQNLYTKTMDSTISLCAVADAGQVAVVAQDADLAACQRIVEGTQTMTVYKPIEQEASMAAELAVRLGKGEDISKEENGISVNETFNDGSNDIPYYKITPVAVTAENMDDVIIDGGFHTREDVYLNVK